MKSIILATLSLALAMPIDVAHSGESAVAANTAAFTPVAPLASELTPLVSVAKDGSLWIGSDAKERLLGTNVQELAQRHVVAKRGLETTQHFRLGGGIGCVSDEPCYEVPPPFPPPPCAPYDEPFPDPCDPCFDSPCGSYYGEPCGLGCAKWLCPDTYCGCGVGGCPGDQSCCNSYNSRHHHPIAGCLTKLLCPSTYCPSNWCGRGCYGGSICCGSDNDFYTDPSFWDDSCLPPPPPPCDPCFA